MNDDKDRCSRCAGSGTCEEDAGHCSECEGSGLAGMALSLWLADKQRYETMKHHTSDAIHYGCPQCASAGLVAHDRTAEEATKTCPIYLRDRDNPRPMEDSDDFGDGMCLRCGGQERDPKTGLGPCCTAKSVSDDASTDADEEIARLAKSLAKKLPFVAPELLEETIAGYLEDARTTSFSRTAALRGLRRERATLDLPDMHLVPLAEYAALLDVVEAARAIPAMSLSLTHRLRLHHALFALDAESPSSGDRDDGGKAR